MEPSCHLLWFAFLIPLAMLVWMHLENRAIEKLIAELNLEITRVELAYAEDKAAEDLLKEKQNAE
jgi:hypothetical protein